MLGPKKVPLLAIALILSLSGFAGAACPAGDVHGDCLINWLDVQDFAEQWLNAGCMAPGCPADLGGGPGVNMVDFALLAANWGIDQEITLLINEFMADNEGTIPIGSRSTTTATIRSIWPECTSQMIRAGSTNRV